MTRRQTRAKLARRRHHVVAQRAKADQALFDAKVTAKAQKKGRKAVESILRNRGYYSTTVRIKHRPVGSRETKVIELERWKAMPKSALPRVAMHNIKGAMG